jgi:hypothetical protein
VFVTVQAKQQVPPLRFAPVGMTELLRELAGSRTRAAIYSSRLRKRSALVITETELKLIAAAAKIGLSSRPKNG